MDPQIVKNCLKEGRIFASNFCLKEGQIFAQTNHSQGPQSSTNQTEDEKFSVVKALQSKESG